MIQEERFVWYYAPESGKECFCENCIENKEVRNSLDIYKKGGIFYSKELGELIEKKNEVIDEDGSKQMEYLLCTNCGEELFCEDCVLFFDNGESVAEKISIARCGFGRLIFDDNDLSVVLAKYDKKFNFIISACKKEISKSYGRIEEFLLFCEKFD
jgi:hypothetical protein